METPFKCAVGMPADEYHHNDSDNVRHRRKQADRRVVFHAEPLDDRWYPESQGGVRADEAKVDESKQPNFWDLQRFTESMLADTCVLLVRL